MGVNSLVYFRHRRTPAEIERLIAEAVRRGLAFGHARRVILIGQSFGADMVHVGLTGLPPALRSRIAMVALVVPTDSVDYQASPAELFDLVSADAPALATARRLTWVPTLCVQGMEETDSLCPLLTAPNVRKVALPGGHPLHGDVDALYARLAEAIGTIGVR
jgi:type IV secretory pathway VirJ component